MVRIRTEERLGSLIAAGGIIWCTYLATKDLAVNSQFTQLPSQPLGICAIGILVWLHAKWRRSLKT